MKAVIWTKYGAPDVLKIGEIQKPSPKDNEILIKVIATTVTLGDCEMRSLSLPIAFKLPIKLIFGITKPKNNTTLGQEFSGVVEDVGANVTRFKKGDEIFGQTDITMGAYSQYMTLKANGTIANKPKNMSFEQVACIPLGGLESQYYTNQLSAIKDGSVIVIGAGGSIGTMGIQLLKLLGYEVTGVDTSEKFKVMKEAGADNFIDYTKENYLQSGLKYDVVFDVVGKNPLNQSLELLKSDGVYLHANPKISHMLFKRFISNSKGKKIIIKGSAESQNGLEHLITLFNQGKINPIIDKVMSLDQIVKAHKYVEAGKKCGNLVIKINH